ncbi:MAG: hypothetical protein ACTSW1_18020, partial [Candidatus Hodarchaeales archaeon]
VELVIGDGEKTTQLDKIAESLKGFNGGTTIFDVRTQEKTIIFRALDVVPKLSKILNIIEEHGVNVENMAIRSTTLEDVFIHLTGRALRN